MIQANEKHPDLELLDVLSKPLVIHDKWSEEEKAEFMSALKKHGKNYRLIQKAVVTKTRE